VGVLAGFAAGVQFVSQVAGPAITSVIENYSCRSSRHITLIHDRLNWCVWVSHDLYLDDSTIDVTQEMLRISIPNDALESEDLLSPHAQVGQTIFELISSEAIGMNVALVGSWGSGKSAVVEHIKRLAFQNRRSRTEELDVFVFDVWPYQGDPVRSSFLLGLVDFAKAQYSAPERLIQEWSKQIDGAIGRRERATSKVDRALSGWGMAIAASLFFCPSIATMAAQKWVLNDRSTHWLGMVGLLMALLPPILTLVAWLKSGRDLHELTGMLLREARQETTTETIRTKEATAIDFRRIYRSILMWILGRPYRKILIVIDNLDRIPPEDAMTLWTTIRILFDFSDQVNHLYANRAWLLVPFDKMALTKLFDEPTVAESFLKKTFPVQFHLTPPVLTNWKALFESQFRKRFRVTESDEKSYFEDCRQATYQLFSILGPATRTPRDVKVFLNRVATIALEWRGSQSGAFQLPFLAAYVMVESKLSDHGEELLESGPRAVLSQDAINVLSRFDHAVNWQEAIAAIHFRVPADDAIQVILVPRIKELIEFDSPDLTGLASIPHFWPVFERFVSDQHKEWTEDPQALPKIVNGLSHLARAGEAESIDRCWSLLLGTAAQCSTRGNFRERDAQAVTILVSEARRLLRVRDASYVVNNALDRLDTRQSIDVRALQVVMDAGSTINEAFNRSYLVNAQAFVEACFDSLDITDCSAIHAIRCHEPSAIPSVLATQLRRPGFPAVRRVMGKNYASEVGPQLVSWVKSRLANTGYDLAEIEWLTRELQPTEWGSVADGELDSQLNLCWNMKNWTKLSRLALFAFAAGRTVQNLNLWDKASFCRSFADWLIDLRVIPHFDLPREVADLVQSIVVERLQGEQLEAELIALQFARRLHAFAQIAPPSSSIFNSRVPQALGSAIGNEWSRNLPSEWSAVDFGRGRQLFVSSSPAGVSEIQKIDSEITTLHAGLIEGRISHQGHLASWRSLLNRQAALTTEDPTIQKKAEDLINLADGDPL
jgi:hypothetical protein